MWLLSEGPVQKTVLNIKEKDSGGYKYPTVIIN